MSIDIPRVQPIVTPPAAALNDDLRVQQTPRVDPVPAAGARPRVERRVVPDRRARQERRLAALDLRARQDRRIATRVDVDA
jgi:hypothetical protein